MEKVSQPFGLVFFCLEVINLVNCIKNNDVEFQPLLRDCGEEHIDELGFKLGHNPEEIDAAEICRSVPYMCFLLLF